MAYLFKGNYVLKCSIKCRNFVGISLQQHFKTVKGMMDTNLSSALREIPPEMENTRKGDAGRIAIIGGSSEYTGAPYFAAISALKVGADLVHVFTTQSAASVIKAYSPDLIVHPLLDDDDAYNKIIRWLKNMHVIVIGPGLGREDPILDVVANIIQFTRESNLPLVIDADGLYLISKRIDLVKCYPYPGVILTPNKVEIDRLSGVIGKDADTDIVNFSELGDFVSILKKDHTDSFHCSDKQLQWSISDGGSARRVGGQGDLLSGTLAVFFYWSLKRYEQQPKTMFPAYLASYGAARITRDYNKRTFEEKGRSMVTSDMIDKINESYKNMFH